MHLDCQGGYTIQLARFTGYQNVLNAKVAIVHSGENRDLTIARLGGFRIVTVQLIHEDEHERSANEDAHNFSLPTMRSFWSSIRKSQRTANRPRLVDS